MSTLYYRLSAGVALAIISVDVGLKRIYIEPIASTRAASCY